MSESEPAEHNDEGLAPDRTHIEEGVEAPSIELNLRLDENGRTTYDPSHVSQTKFNCSNDFVDNDAHVDKKLKTEMQMDAVDYSSKTVLTCLHDCELHDAMDSLLFDCEVN
jgi:hypothetical protein